MSWFTTSKMLPATTATVGSGSTSGPTNPQTTIKALRESIVNQERREDCVSRRIDSAVKEAKEKMGNGDKKGALFAMKRKKLYEAEVDKIQNVKITLETQIINLESAHQNAQTFKVMEAGVKTMQQIRADVSLDDVDKVLDASKDETELCQEIDAALSQQVDPLDEDELLQELVKLETSNLEERLRTSPEKIVQTDSLSLPVVPTNGIGASKKEDGADLKQLEAELAAL